MSNEFNNEMENYEAENFDGAVEGEETKSGNGYGKLALLGLGAAVLGGLVAEGIDKLKEKKANGPKPKKEKVKYRWKRVPVEAKAEEEVSEEIEAEEN